MINKLSLVVSLLCKQVTCQHLSVPVGQLDLRTAGQLDSWRRRRPHLLQELGHIVDLVVDDDPCGLEGVLRLDL